MFKKPFRYAIVYTIASIVFTLYAVLDTFVIPRAYAVVDKSSQTASIQSTSTTASTISQISSLAQSSRSTSESVQSEQFASSQPSQSSSVNTEPVVTDSSYQDENISISITQYRESDTTIYVADVVVSDASYLKAAFSQSTYGRNITEKTSVIAKESNAILAINGDYYGARNSGYVIRNGVLYRSTSSDSSQQDLVIYTDGSFGSITEGETSAQKLLDNGAVQVFSFGPALIEDGAVAVSKTDEVDKAMTGNPRTALCIINDLHYLLVVADGRTSESTGLSLYEMAQFLQTLGAKTAYNLDGGGSSTMVFNGKVINKPTTNGRQITERSVSDIVCIGY